MIPKSSLAEAEAERIDRTEPQQKKSNALMKGKRVVCKRMEEPEAMDRKYDIACKYTWLEKFFRDPI